MDCIYCKISKGEVPAKKVYEDANTVAFLDISPRNPGHTLVIPKKHYGSILDIPESELASVMSTVKKVAVATKNATNSDGTSIMQSNGRAAGQIVAHIHFHVIPRFMSEGPPSLEGILQIKRFDDKSMDALVQKIASGMGKSMRTAPKTTAAKPAPAKPKKEGSDEVFADRENLFDDDM